MDRDQILITGGAGFIGSQVGLRLLASGASVVVLDSFDPFYDVRIKHRAVARLRAAGADRFTLIEGDLRDAEACGRAVRGSTGVIHLAALAGVRPSIQDPVRYMDVNVRGTQILLEALRAACAPTVPFVFGSSSSVYGGNTKVPFAESDPVDRPVSPYAASKKAGEVQCAAFHHLHAHPVTCLRFFTVYGPGQRPEMAIHQFTRRIVAGQPLPFFGDGTTRRDYTYVDDIVDGIVAALRQARGYAIYNLGGSHTTTLADLVAKLERALGKRAILDRQPDQPGDVQQTYADVSLVAAELGWRPQVDIDEGIARFVRWYSTEHAAGHVA